MDGISITEIKEGGDSVCVIPLGAESSPAPENISETSSAQEERPSLEPVEQPERVVTGREIRQQKRAQHLAQENSFLRAQLSSFQSELEAKERALEEWRQEATHNKTQYERSLSENLASAEDSLKEQLRQAKVEGDVEKEVAITDRLGEIKADKVRIDMLKVFEANQSSEDEETAFRPDVSPLRSAETAPVEDIPDSLARFYDRNPWADPYSPQYNPQASLKVKEMSDILDDQLQREGRADLFGSDSYFNILERVSKSVLQSPERESRPSYGEKALPSVDHSVLDVDRNGGSRSDVYMQTHKRGGIHLTPTEIQMAKNIGASMGWDDAKSIQTYAANKKKCEQDARSGLSEKEMHIVSI